MALLREACCNLYLRAKLLRRSGLGRVTRATDLAVRGRWVRGAPASQEQEGPASCRESGRQVTQVCDRPKRTLQESRKDIERMTKPSYRNRRRDNGTRMMSILAIRLHRTTGTSMRCPRPRRRPQRALLLALSASITLDDGTGLIERVHFRREDDDDS